MYSVIFREGRSRECACLGREETKAAPEDGPGRGDSGISGRRPGANGRWLTLQISRDDNQNERDYNESKLKTDMQSLKRQSKKRTKSK